MIDDKGIAALSIIPVRAKPSEVSEMVTQLLFGEFYQIIDITNNHKWIKVKILHDGYSGWLDVKQHVKLSENEFESYSIKNYNITSHLITKIIFRSKNILVVMGSTLPNLIHFGVQYPPDVMGSAINSTQKYDLKCLIDMAMRYLGTPYLWGGRSPFGIDCSGFVQIVYRFVGVFLPRDANQQVKTGKKILFKDRKVGDLVFFENGNKKYNHVGMLISQNEIIHASGSVRVDSLNEQGIYNKEIDCVTHEFPLLKRVIKT